MQNIFAKLVMGVAITAIGMFGSDNSLGTWKRNADKTHGSGPKTVKSLEENFPWAKQQSK